MAQKTVRVCDKCGAIPKAYRRGEEAAALLVRMSLGSADMARECCMSCFLELLEQAKANQEGKDKEEK